MEVMDGVGGVCVECAVGRVCDVVNWAWRMR
jgi:hypothetical protein